MRRLALAAAALGLSCATLAGGEGGDANLPNAHAGPFRKATQGELGNLRSAPNAMDDTRLFARDVAVIDADGDPATYEVAGYFAVTIAPEGEEPSPTAPPNGIARFGALDARSFDRARLVVLAPELPWEGGTVGAPTIVRRSGELFLYYAAAGGVGLARSADGIAFTRESAPVLAPDASGWEAGKAPASPGVVVLGDGSLRMFYEVAGEGGASRIGEARSDDGVAWTRMHDGPVLEPSPAPAAVGPDDDEPYDDASVGSPFPVLATSAEGRAILRVYYAARDGAGRGTIALSARLGVDGPLVRAVSPVFGTGESLSPREPCVLVYPGFSLLFATQRAGRTSGKDYPAVAVGVAPADAVLPPASAE